MRLRRKQRQRGRQRDLSRNNPLNPDSDCDGVLDGQEILNGTNPLDEPGCGPDSEFADSDWSPDSALDGADATQDVTSDAEEGDSQLHVGGGCCCVCALVPR